jgi:hypothetical protein
MNMFTAKPNINNNIDMQTFDTEKEAVSYLNSTTGFAMQADDWRTLGKLKEDKNPPF